MVSLLFLVLDLHPGGMLEDRSKCRIDFGMAHQWYIRFTIDITEEAQAKMVHYTER